MGRAIASNANAPGVGHRADLLAAALRATQFPVVIPTGICREPWLPGWARDADQAQIREWKRGELTGTIEGSDMQAAWIKLSAGDDDLTPPPKPGFCARQRIVRDQQDIIEAESYTAKRFIWIHAQVEEDFALNLEIARRDAWIEYDWIGGCVR